MRSEWEDLRNQRKASLDLAGKYYSGSFAKSHGLNGREKGVSGPFDELPVDVTEKEWKDNWDKMLLKSRVWVPEPVEVVVSEVGKFLCRFNPDIYSDKQTEEFDTSLGSFVSHNQGEFGGEMVLPDGKTMIGNFCEVVECGGVVYAIDSNNHLGMGHINVYAFDEALSPKLLYGRGIMAAIFGGLLLADEDDLTEEWLSLNSFYQADGSLYIMASGQVRSGKESKWKDVSKLLQFKNGQLIRTTDFPQGLPRVYSMVIHDDNLILGFDKVAAIFNLEGALMESYTLINQEAEEDISRQRRKR